MDRDDDGNAAVRERPAQPRAVVDVGARPGRAHATERRVPYEVHSECDEMASQCSTLLRNAPADLHHVNIAARAQSGGELAAIARNASVGLPLIRCVEGDSESHGKGTKLTLEAC